LGKNKKSPGSPKVITSTPQKSVLIPMSSTSPHHRQHQHQQSFVTNTDTTTTTTADSSVLDKTQLENKKRHQQQAKSAHNMNMRGVFLHVLGDALGSVIVVVSAAVVQWTDWKYRFYLDPVLSILMSLIIIRSTWPLR
jgi:zinc transporter 1